VLLPDGRHFLYLSFGTKTIDRTLRLAALDESGHADLLRNVSFARLYAGDRLVFVRDGKLLVQRFDASKGVMQGDAVTVANAVSYFYMTARADFDASPSGVIVYRTNTASGTLRLFDRAGRVVRTLDPRVLTWDHAISPDGRKAAVTIVSPDTGLLDIWIYDLARGLRDRLTNHPAIEVSPAWSPDGRWIAYSQGEGGTFPHIVRMPVGGGSPPEDLTRGGGFEFAPGFTPDGRSIYFAVDGGRNADIVRLALDSRQVVPAIATSFVETTPRVSPDGKWLAYESNATGVAEIYVQSLAGGPRVRISRDGGTQPSWRGDGQELFYLAEGTIYSASPGPGGNWENATTTELFRFANIGKSFAATPDGQSFLLATYARGVQDELLHVIVGM
jgi:serine/threonine-protein kinase